MTTAAQTMAQARNWLVQRLSALGGAGVLVGVDVAQIAMNGQVGYGLRVIAKPEGVSWIKQFGLPGLLETPYGNLYVAVAVSQQGGAVSAQPGQAVRPGSPPGPASADPYKDWQVKVSGTDLEHSHIKYFGTDPKEIDSVKVSGSDVAPKPQKGPKEFKPKGFGSAFPGFGGED